MTDLLFSFKGRINRAKMWLIYLIVSLALGLPMAVVIATLHEDLVGANSLPATLAFGVNWLFWAWTIVVFYVAVAGVVKRLHDRGKSAAWLLIFYGIPVVSFTAAYFMMWPPRAVFPGANVVMFGLFAVTFVNNIWYLLELFALPGTKGDNRFGPDPRAGRLPAS